MRYLALLYDVIACMFHWTLSRWCEKYIFQLKSYCIFFGINVVSIYLFFVFTQPNFLHNSWINPLIMSRYVSVNTVTVSLIRYENAISYRSREMYGTSPRVEINLFMKMNSYALQLSTSTNRYGLSPCFMLIPSHAHDARENDYCGAIIECHRDYKRL